ncbi:hypothetical protein ACIQUF_11775 [Pseudomonas sp. NPDC090233]|uniref:hypothetical protein n=1 Tax=Pseudomonas sp. NPDC090233 TaxID=3364479 RepID=UPI00383ADA47
MIISSKDQRSAGYDLATLFKLKLMNEYDAFKKLGSLASLEREIRTPGGIKVYLSKESMDCFVRLKKITAKYLSNRKILDDGDICQSCRYALGYLYENEPNNLELAQFIQLAEDASQKPISTHKFITSMAGLNFDNITELNLGSLTLLLPQKEILDSAIAREGQIENAWADMKSYLWITSEINGSIDFAERRFFKIVKTSLGLLALAFSLLLERGGAVVSLIPSIEGRMRPRTVTWLSIDKNSNNLRTKTDMQGIQALTLTKEVKTLLEETPWLPALITIAQTDVPQNDLASAVQRALYWFFDAQTDPILEMRFVKFWSCIECIFALSDKKDTVLRIKKGLRSLLHKRYRDTDPSPHFDFEKQITDMYDLRCVAVHQAHHDHVCIKHITAVSKWAADALIETSILIGEGVNSRKKLKEQIDMIYSTIPIQTA